MSRLLRRATPGLSLAFAAILPLLLFPPPPLHAIDLDGNGISDVYQALYPLPPGKAYDDDPATGDLCDPVREDIVVGPYTNRQKALLGVPPTAGLPMPLSIEADIPGNRVLLTFPTVAGKQYQILRGEIVDLPSGQEQTVETCEGPVTYFKRLEPTAVGAVIYGSGSVEQIAIPGLPLAGQALLYSYTCLGDYDADGDRLNAWEERQLGTSDSTRDSDNDLLPDDYEFLTPGMDPLNPDVNADGIPDGAEDSDGDFDNNATEILNGTDPLDGTDYTDADGDRMGDGFETLHWGSPDATNDPGGNEDGDPLVNADEFALRTNPTIAMTYGVHKDGHADQDGDAVIDIWELEDNTDPFTWDADIRTNYVCVTMRIERKASWGGVPIPPGYSEQQAYQELMRGTKFTIRAKNYETADQATTTSGIGLKRGVINVLSTDSTPIRSQGDGYYYAYQLMFMRKNVEYDVKLTTTNENLPFVSARIHWTPIGTGFPYSTLNEDEPENRLVFQEVDDVQWYRTGDTGTAVIPVEELEPDPDPHNTVFTLKGPSSAINGPGGAATNRSTGTALLLPFELITRDSKTGKEKPVDFSTSPPSHPVPQVDLEVTNTQLNGRELTIELSGQVWDALSEVADQASNRVQNVLIKVNGQTVKTLPLAATGGGQAPWTVCTFKPTFQTSITIPETDGDCIQIRAETSENAAGNKGWREVAVTLGWEDFAYSDPPNLDAIRNGLHIAFDGATDPDAIDTLRVYFGDRGPEPGDAVLAETGINTLVFSGSMVVEGNSVNCEVSTSGNIVANPQSREGLAATAQYGATQATGVWQETALNSNVFILDTTQLPPRPARKVFATTQVVGASKAGWFQPMLWRSELPEELAESDAFKLKVNDIEQTLKGFTYSPKKYYVVKNGGDNRPQLYAITAESLPEALALNPPDFDLSPGGEPVSYTLQIGDGMEPVEMGTISYFEDDFGSFNPMDRQQEDLTESTLLTFFRLLYKEDGLKLLGWFQESGGTLEIVETGSILNLWSKKLDVKYPDPQTGKIKISIDKQVNPIQGAQLLWQGLQQSLPLHPFKEVIITKATSGETYNDLTFSYETMKAMNRQIQQQAAQVAIDATNLYLSGIGIVSEGADWVITIHEVSQGNNAALVSVLPFVAAGTVVIIKDHLGNVIGEIGEEVASVLRGIFVPGGANIATARARLRAMDDIEFLVANSSAPPAIIEAYVDAARLPIIDPKTCREFLREQLAPRPATMVNPQAHHDLPVMHQRFFLSRGLDINKKDYGRWVEGVPPGLHQKWTPAFNREWGEWIAANPHATQADVLQKMNQMRADPRFQ